MSGFKIPFTFMNFAKDQVQPIFRENRNGLWIDYGDNNLYPEYLLDIYLHKSNKHKSIIGRKVSMTTGNGVEDPVSEELKKFLKNQYGEYDIEELLVKSNYDLEIFGGFALQVRWNLDGTKIAALDYIPFHKVRLSTNEGMVYISKDWSQHRRKENVPYEMKMFSPLEAKEHPTQIFYFLTQTVGQEYYPIPSYSSTLTWIEMDYEIGNFHLSSLRNGFMPGFLINFATGIPTKEEMDMAHKEFTKKYTGTEEANRLILAFSNGRDEAPELTPIELNDTDERFLMLHKEMKEEIFIGHEVTSPMLFAVRTEGQLGGKSEILEALAMFQSTYINYKQKIIEKQFNKLSNWFGVDEEIILEKYEIDFGTIEMEEDINKLD